jgi:hypothetical protein
MTGAIGFHLLAAVMTVSGAHERLMLTAASAAGPAACRILLKSRVRRFHQDEQAREFLLSLIVN